MPAPRCLGPPSHRRSNSPGPTRPSATIRSRPSPPTTTARPPPRRRPRFMCCPVQRRCRSAVQQCRSPATPLTAGLHMMRVVIDTKGTSGWMGNVNYFRWTAPGVNGPPTVGLTAPADGANYLAPATIAFTATASDPDGSVTQVSFYAGSTLLATDTGTPYTFTWSNVPVGNYSLTAVATDNSGASTTSGAVVVHVVNPPNSTPFGGTPTPIPGLIEAEKFDDGGEGLA